MEEMEQLVKSIQEWLIKNKDPHHKIVIDIDGVELYGVELFYEEFYIPNKNIPN